MVKVNVVFNFDGKKIPIQCKTDDKMEKIIEQFKNQIQNNNKKNHNNINLNSLIYKYENGQINNMNLKFDEIFKYSPQQNKNMEILVEQPPADIIETNTSSMQINRDDRIDATKPLKKELTCFKANKKAIIIGGSIIGAILIIAIIIIIVVVLKKNNKTNKKIIDSSDENDSDIPINTAVADNQDFDTYRPIVDHERCLTFHDSIENYCEKCKDDYELYKGDCILYTFYVEYIINNNEKIKLYNPDNINGLFAMKLNGEIRGPYSEFSFESNKLIYYYFDENIDISLSNMFENNDKLKYFNFNVKYINNFKITNMFRMFAGCTSLETISFDTFKGENVINMAHTFDNCQSLKSFSFSSFEGVNVQSMNSLFCACISLKNLDFRGLKTQNLVDTSFMFLNCSSLTYLDLSNFITEKVTSMRSMFGRCTSLVS